MVELFVHDCYGFCKNEYKLVTKINNELTVTKTAIRKRFLRRLLAISSSVRIFEMPPRSGSSKNDLASSMPKNDWSVNSMSRMSPTPAENPKKTPMMIMSALFGFDGFRGR